MFCAALLSGSCEKPAYTAGGEPESPRTAVNDMKSLHKNKASVFAFACAGRGRVGINMGKTRGLKWGLYLLGCGALLAAAVHSFVINEGQDALPAPTPTPAAGELQGLTVCLDPGHGGYDGGAYGRDSGTPEKELNLDVAKRLGELLAQAGARVILTRGEDVALADEGSMRKRRDLQARVDAAAEADLFLSIHMNEYRTRAESGPQVFYRKGQDASRLLAGFLQQHLNAALSPAKPRSASAGKYYVLENLSIPAVLVECGFLSNPAEEALLLTPDYRQRVAEALCEGIAEYWKTGAGRNEQAAVPFGSGKG